MTTGWIVLFLVVVLIVLTLIDAMRDRHQVEQCILDMLAASPEPMYGLDMVKQSGGILKRGVVYAHLGRLQDRGLVASTGPDADGRFRYTLACLTSQPNPCIALCRECRVGGSCIRGPR